jgi:hypothetical protein
MGWSGLAVGSVRRCGEWQASESAAILSKLNPNALEKHHIKTSIYPSEENGMLEQQPGTIWFRSRKKKGFEGLL